MNEFSMKISEIIRLTGAKSQRLAAEDTIINDILIDSRLLGDPKGVMFAAIKTVRNDGHKYIGDLYKLGVRSFIGTEDYNYIKDLFPVDDQMVTYLRVDNTILALQQITAEWRKTLLYPIVGITGSNGKTVVKEWLWQLLSSKIKICRSPKSFNSQIGVPLSVIKLQKNSDLGIIEVGISLKGEMDLLERVVGPEIGIITNVGTAHIKNFSDKKELTEEKLKLFKHSKAIIYHDNDPELEAMLKETCPHKTLLPWTSEQNRKDLEDLGVSERFSDKASFENIGHCLAMIKYLGYGIYDFKSQIKSLSPLEMRLEIKEGINGCLILNDCYSLDVNSFAIAVDSLAQQPRYSKKTVIMSTFERQEDVEKVAVIMNSKPVSKIVIIGEEAARQRDCFNAESIIVYKTPEDFIRKFNKEDFINEAILIKGARRYLFERISSLLQQKEHETVLEISVEALKNNLNTFRRLLRRETKMLVMVKASSYGTGSVEVADIMEANNVDYMAVAFVDEGIELRDMGIKQPVIVMNPEADALQAMIKYNLEPEIYSFKRLEQFCSVLRKGEQNKPYNVHIKIDTGMHRLGFEEGDIDPLIEVLMANKGLIHVSSIFSHLACADDPAKDDFTRRQIVCLQKVAQKVETALGYTVIKHILNSIGIVRFPEAQMDMVRLGIGLYGVEENLQKLLNLDVALKLKSVISQIRNIPAGDGVGYGQTWISPNPSSIAIIPIGYADGYSLALSNSGAKVYINGQFAPVVGRVCMDMCFIDVTGLAISEGDEVELFGEHVLLSELAKCAGTIPYEIISTLSRRVKRIYYR